MLAEDPADQAEKVRENIKRQKIEELQAILTQVRRYLYKIFSEISKLEKDAEEANSEKKEVGGSLYLQL